MAKSHIRSLLLAAVMLGAVLAFALMPRFFFPQKIDTPGARITQGTSFPLTVQDTLGRSIRIEREPKRIISISPAVTEIVYAIGVGDKIIADTTYCDYPAAAAKLPKVGGYLDPNVEKIMALHADLVIGQRGTERGVLDQIHHLGQPIVVVDPTNLQETSQTIRLIGQITGASTRATQLADQCDARVEKIAKKYQSLTASERPRVLFLFALTGGIFTAGPKTHLDEMIRLAGGTNIAADAKTQWPQLSMEAVVQADPQVILLVKGDHGEQQAMTTGKVLEHFRADAQWRTASAVKQGRVVLIDDDLVTLPGPRMVQGLEAMAMALHPEHSSREAAE